jgi:hypothetical protein
LRATKKLLTLPIGRKIFQALRIDAIHQLRHHAKAVARLDALYTSLVLNRWQAWQNFREERPALWAVLYQGYRVYQLRRRVTHRALYRCFRP